MYHKSTSSVGHEHLASARTIENGGNVLSWDGEKAAKAAASCILRAKAARGESKRIMWLEASAAIDGTRYGNRGTQPQCSILQRAKMGDRIRIDMATKTAVAASGGEVRNRRTQL
eukprot:SAG31_NODE_667_length_12948_cov_70.090746_8_plen_115_part_00